MNAKQWPSALAVVVFLGCTSTGEEYARPPAGSGGSGGSGGEGGTCVPPSCESLGAECGQVLEPCGTILSCGQCPSGEVCGAESPNLCGAGECAPKTCAQLGAACGVLGDDCANVLDCGSCADGLVCGEQVPNQCGTTGSGGMGGAGTGGSGGTPEAGTGGTGGYVDNRRLRYYVLPHPDDEYEAWSLLDGDDTHYVVFVLFTRGEQSGHCNGAGFEPGTGERQPLPAGFEGRWSAHCAEQRIDSWHYFLDAMAASANPELGTVAFVRHDTAPGLAGSVAPQRCDSLDPAPYSNCSTSRSYDLWVGTSSARVVFDLGDGDLTRDEVVWAIDTVRGFAGEFPVQLEDDLVGASYRNAVAAYGYEYPHPDHHAVHLALWNNDFGLPGPQIAATAPGDPDATIVRQVPSATHEAAWGLGPNDQRVGWGQVAYGWLTTGAWTNCTIAGEYVICSDQVFWSRF